MRKLLFIISLFTFVTCNIFASPDGREEKAENGGYLFAHMTSESYGSMFYSISRDGVEWQSLNNGMRICDYNGHHDFCQKKDGGYYMIGIERGTLQPLLWATSDLITWGVEKQIPKSVFNTDEAGYSPGGAYGAPKMYYDWDSGQYIITWHAYETRYSPRNTDNQTHWESMRTFYVLTSDFNSFSKPQRLFNFTGTYSSMATLDVIIRKENGKYYAFIKDERWPCIEGYKAIHIARSDNLTGPYENPGDAITAPWREAPTVVRNPQDNGWFLYVENYLSFEYVLYEAANFEDTWKAQGTITYPARHGSIIRVNESTYQELLRAYK